MSNAAIRAKVKAVNMAHLIARKIVSRMTPIFEPAVGKQVLSSNMTLLLKYRKQLTWMQQLEKDTPGLRIYWITPHDEMTWGIDINLPVPAGRPYGFSIGYKQKGISFTQHTTIVRIGTLNGGKLTGIIMESATWRTNFTVKEVEAKRKDYSDAQSLADAAYAALQPFSEFDSIATQS